MKEDERGIVKHHNYINESIFNFNSLELNVFVAIIYKMHKMNREVVFDVKDIKKYLNSKDRSYATFERVIKKLQKQSIELKHKDGYMSIMPFPTLDFNLTEKTVTVECNSKIVPLLRDLKKQFTLYSIDEFISLENKYSKRMFQLLKQYEKIGRRNFELHYLKDILMADYDRFYDFERFVLKKAKEDINKYTTLEVDYTKKKAGRSVKSIEFSIKKKTKKYDKNEETKFETRKDIIKRSLETFGVKFIKDLDKNQKKLLNITLKKKNFNGVR